jgi:hypothetical protein
LRSMRSFAANSSPKKQEVPGLYYESSLDRNDAAAHAAEPF